MQKDTVLEKIYKSGLKLLVPTTPQETYSIIVHEAVKLIKGYQSILLLYQSGKLQVVYSYPQNTTSFQLRAKGLAYTAFREQKSFLVNVQEFSKKVSNQKKRDSFNQSVIFVPLYYRNKSFGVLIVRSSKGRKRLFSEKHLNILKLFGSIASLAVRNMQLFDETKQLLQMRDLFLSMAAHQLRTPLTAVNGYAQLLYEHKIAGKCACNSSWIESMVWETHRLTHIINELLVINRLKNGGLKYLWSSCHLTSVIKTAMMDFRFHYPHRSIIFRNNIKDVSDMIIGDQEKLSQVIINVLDNAAKFSPENEKIFISIDSASDYLIVKVKDQGRGIPKDEITKVFDCYYKGSNSLDMGMGIGLYLAKQIIEQHQGTITISSQPQNGTLVSIKLPSMNVL